MDNTGLLERPPEEVSAPPSTSSSRFTGLAVLASVAAVVLGITALGGPGTTLNGGSQLAANGAAAGQPAEPGSGHAAMAPPDAPAGSSGTGGHQAAPGAAGAPAGADAGQQAPVEHIVSMEGLQFVPALLNVAVNDTVTWVNNDNALHTVTVTDGPQTFESELLEPGDTFTYTFTQAGTYEYYCAVHPDMKASVVVTGVDAPPVDGAAPPAPVEEDTAGCVTSTALDALMRHIEAAHLQTSPGQQVKDLASVDQYVKTHTILLNDMFKPAFDGAVSDGLAKSLNALRTHLEVAHLQTSPGQQAADLLALDQYVKTHTVLAQDTVAPHMDYTAC
ncbi:MAG: cupredoxin domain-containing protein [Pseudonocardiaceae bacterium]